MIFFKATNNPNIGAYGQFFIISNRSNRGIVNMQKEGRIFVSFSYTCKLVDFIVILHFFHKEKKFFSLCICLDLHTNAAVCLQLGYFSAVKLKLCILWFIFFSCIEIHCLVETIAKSSNFFHFEKKNFFERKKINLCF